MPDCGDDRGTACIGYSEDRRPDRESRAHRQGPRRGLRSNWCVRARTPTPHLRRPSGLTTAKAARRRAAHGSGRVLSSPSPRQSSARRRPRRHWPRLLIFRARLAVRCSSVNAFWKRWTFFTGAGQFAADSRLHNFKDPGGRTPILPHDHDPRPWGSPGSGDGRRHRARDPARLLRRPPRHARRAPRSPCSRSSSSWLCGPATSGRRVLRQIVLYGPGHGFVHWLVELDGARQPVARAARQLELGSLARLYVHLPVAPVRAPAAIYAALGRVPDSYLQASRGPGARRAGRDVPARAMLPLIRTRHRRQARVFSLSLTLGDYIAPQPRGESRVLHRQSRSYDNVGVAGNNAARSPPRSPSCRSRSWPSISGSRAKRAGAFEAL